MVHSSRRTVYYLNKDFFFLVLTFDNMSVWFRRLKYLCICLLYIYDLFFGLITCLYDFDG